MTVGVAAGGWADDVADVADERTRGNANGPSGIR